MKTEYQTTFYITRWLKDHMGIKTSRAFHIHHIDHNPRNNNMDNLIRLNPREHKLAHLRQAPISTPGFKHWLKELRKIEPDWDS